MKVMSYLVERTPCALSNKRAADPPVGLVRRIERGRVRPPCLVFLAFLVSASAQTRTVTDAEVMRVHRSALLIDTHNDVPSRTVDGFDFGPRAASGHTDIARMKEGGVGATFFAVYVAARFVEGNHSANRTLLMIDTVLHDII